MSVKSKALAISVSHSVCLLQLWRTRVDKDHVASLQPQQFTTPATDGWLLLLFFFSCIINQRWFVAKRLKAGFWRLMHSEWEFHISSPQPASPFPRAFVFTTIVNIYYALNKHAPRSINIIESKELWLRSSVITCSFILLRIQMEISLLVCRLTKGETTLWMRRATICLYFIMKTRFIIFSGWSSVLTTN